MGIPRIRIVAFWGLYWGLPIWGFPKIRGTLLKVPIIRTIVLKGLYWGSPILGNYHTVQGLGLRVLRVKGCGFRESFLGHGSKVSL